MPRGSDNFPSNVFRKEMFRAVVYSRQVNCKPKRSEIKSRAIKPYQCGLHRPFMLNNDDQHFPRSDLGRVENPFRVHAINEI